MKKSVHQFMSAGILGIIIMIATWAIFVHTYRPDTLATSNPCDRDNSVCMQNQNLVNFEQAFKDRALEAETEYVSSTTAPELSVISVRDTRRYPVQKILNFLSQSQLAQVSRSLFTSLPAPIAPTKSIDLVHNPDAWVLVQTLIPSDQLHRITEYREASDGPSNTLAYVESNRGIGDEWSLTVDPVDAYQNGEFYNFQKLVITLVHEFGHSIQLDNTQIEYKLGRFNCSENVFLALEGCTLPDSYLQKFVNQFWTPYLVDFYAQQGDSLKRAGFYLNHQTDFINRYSATDPVEDLAESWAAFVLTTRRGYVPGSTVPNQKIEFFYRYPELVALRDDIRGRLAYVLNQLSV